jgi:hypothetical protein
MFETMVVVLGTFLTQKPLVFNTNMCASSPTLTKITLKIMPFIFPK